MKKWFLFLLVLGLAALAHGYGYVWLTDSEDRVLGDIDGEYQPFGSGDTLSGVIRSNDTITIAGDGTYGLIITSAPTFIQGPEYDPTFTEPPIFNAPLIVIPEFATILRQGATHYYDFGANQQMRINIYGGMAFVYRWDLGAAFDSLEATLVDVVSLAGTETCIFTENRLELKGIGVIGSVTIGSGRLIRLMDDVRVGGPTSGPPQYRVDPTNQNYIGIVSEGDIKIANTWANGRENSNGLGFGQNNPHLTDIVINAAVVALGGGLTFEQQNDPDSGYVCGCSPDWRGDIYLWGSVTQHQHGYLSRTNNAGTGYRLRLRLDPRFLRHAPPCFAEDADSTSTDTLNFGNVVIGQTVVDTAHVYVWDYSTLGMASATAPFTVEAELPQFGTHFIIPISFAPTSAMSYSGLLQVTTTFDYFEIPLRGRGVLPNAADSTFIVPRSSFLVSAYPNPFNATTTITFELPQSGHVTAELFDLSGRHMSTLTDQIHSGGTHQLVIDGTALPSGLYFLQVATPAHQSTHKLLLIK